MPKVAIVEFGAAPSAARSCSTGAGRGLRFSGIVGRGCGATMELGLLAATGSRPSCRRAIALTGGLNVELSSRFSGWHSQSLSLGEGLTDLTGARDGTRADAVLDRGRRRLFSF